MDALKIDKAVLGGFDWGARTVNIIAALWPQRCKAMVSVSGYLIGSQEANRAPLPPQAELTWWYQFYFATERGRAGYEANRHDFNKLIWHTAFSKWGFDDATFERTAASFNNPDHVAVVIHNYRWRLGLAQGEPQYGELEKRLATAPTISVQTITLEGDANGAAHPAPAAYAEKFAGKYEHRNLSGGIGHNLPQEAPRRLPRRLSTWRAWRNAGRRTPAVPASNPNSRRSMRAPGVFSWARAMEERLQETWNGTGNTQSRFLYRNVSVPYVDKHACTKREKENIPDTLARSNVLTQG